MAEKNKDLFGLPTDEGRPGKFSPLADRMRPRQLSEFAGQEHILGSSGVLRKMIESDHIS